MKKTVDVAEFIKKIKLATDHSLNQDTKNSEKIICDFFCKHGYTPKECRCLNKSAV